MKRTNAVEVVVKSPTAGLITRYPSNLPSIKTKKALVAASNVRAERGVLSAAPGYERIVPSPENIDGPANMVWQSRLFGQDEDGATTPFVGTTQSLYTVHRRARPLNCIYRGPGGPGGPGGTACELVVGFVGDSGRVSQDAQDVANLISGWPLDVLIHTGDMVYSDGDPSPSGSFYEDEVARYYSAFIGGYAGTYTPGPIENKFFPVLGNHDWDDVGLAAYLDFFRLPLNPNERYFTYKRGPVQFFHMSGYNGVEPAGVGEADPQGIWLKAALLASDCPWRIVVVHFPPYTSDDTHAPGETALRWLRPDLGISALVCGHAHDSEICIDSNGLTSFITGTGGHSLRGFTTPVAESVWRDSTDYGALKLTANTTSLVFEYWNRSGIMIRSHTLTNASPSSGVCYTGSSGKVVFVLTIEPASARGEVGFGQQYRAWANYTDGTVLEVTTQSIWTSSDDSVASIGETSGKATGVGFGTAVITAFFGGQSATATFKVDFSCIDDAWEVAFVVDRSLLSGTSSGGSSKLENIKEGIRSAISRFDPTRDKLTLISFGGTFATQTEDVTLDVPLTSNFSDMLDGLSLLTPRGDRGITSGLDTARSELTGIRHSSTITQRAVVLVVVGPGDVTDPGGDHSSEAAAIVAAMATAQITADQLRDTGYLVAVVGYNISPAYQTSLKALSSSASEPGYYFGVETAEDLKNALAGLSSLFCLFNIYYGYNASPCGVPVLDYDHFAHWDVVRGCVDLIGNGDVGLPQYDLLPGNGLYLDLVGTDLNLSYPRPVTRDSGTNALLRSKIAYTFEHGKTYRLSFYIAGVNRSFTDPVTHEDRPFPAWCNVSIEIFLGVQRIEPSDPFQDFTLYEFNFTVPGSLDGVGRIIFDQNPFTRGTVGLLLDRVKLENVTDSAIMLYDDFDSENPC